VNQIAGPVALALVGLWLAYLVPHKLRHRQQILEARTDDRYSEALRVVAVTDRPGRPARDVRPRAAVTPGHGTSGTRGLLTPGKGLPIRAGSATGGRTVDRPHAMQDRMTADAARRAAQARAARAAAVARRAAAARRRGVLAAVLVVATLAGWASVWLLPAATWVAGVVPTVLLAAVVVLGRRAVLVGREADAAWAARMEQERRSTGDVRTGAMRAVATAAAATRSAATERSTADRSDVGRGAADTTVAEARSRAGEHSAHESAQDDGRRTELPFVTGHAVRPSDAQTEVFARIVADGGEADTPLAAARHATGMARRASSTPTAPVASVRATGSSSPAPRTLDDASDQVRDESWSPVPVPRPTYTMKPAAPRREPAPLTDVEASTTTRPASAEEPAAAPASEASAEPAPLEPAAETTGGIDLDAVLAKRRASGA